MIPEISDEQMKHCVGLTECRALENVRLITSIKN